MGRPETEHILTRSFFRPVSTQTPSKNSADCGLRAYVCLWLSLSTAARRSQRANGHTIRGYWCCRRTQELNGMATPLSAPTVHGRPSRFKCDKKRRKAVAAGRGLLLRPVLGFQFQLKRGRVARVRGSQLPLTNGSNQPMQQTSYPAFAT